MSKTPDLTMGTPDRLSNHLESCRFLDDIIDGSPEDDARIWFENATPAMRLAAFIQLDRKVRLQPVGVAEKSEFPPHPLSMPANRTGAMDMQAGDRFRYRGRTGRVDEFLSDGDALVTFDDGEYAEIKWARMEPL